MLNLWEYLPAWFPCGCTQIPSGKFLGCSCGSLHHSNWLFLLSWTSPSPCLPSSYPTGLGGLIPPAVSVLYAWMTNPEIRHMSLLAPASLHLLGISLLSCRCGMGEGRRGDQMCVVLCSWLILCYSTGLDWKWCISGNQMIVYDVYRRKADVSINGRAENNPKAGWF